MSAGGRLTATPLALSGRASYAAVAIVTLALGIGATTIIFNVDHSHRAVPTDADRLASATP
jgi:hypothetical protein